MDSHLNPQLESIELQTQSHNLNEQEEDSLLSENDDLETYLPWNTASDAKSTPFLILLTVGLGGLQMIFSVLYSYGIPHLRSLGLDKSQAAMTFIVGPISGIFVQPCFGVWSDLCTSSSGKRRPFILYGAAALIVSLMALAWTTSIVNLLFPTSLNPNTQDTTNSATTTLAISLTCFVYLAIQPVQSGTRALIADTCPAHQQQQANAWASRITGIASVIGYSSAFMDLPQYLSYFGDTQFKNLSVLASFSLALSIALTCTFIREETPHDNIKEISEEEETFMEQISLPFDRLMNLPKQIIYICVVQLFAWMGWYPYLLYVSTYVADIYSASSYAQTSSQVNLTSDSILGHATRLGAFTLLISSTIALLTATLLPLLAKSWDASNSPDTRKGGRVLLSKHIIAPWLTMRRIWIASHCLFALCLCSSIFISSVFGTITVFGIVGISWAIANWIPYTLLSIEISQNREEAFESSTSPSLSSQSHVTAGIVFGLHNIAICIPQVLISIGSSLFWGLQDEEAQKDPNSIGWVLRIGGVAALFALWMTVKVQDPGKSDEYTGQNIELNMEGWQSGDGLSHIPYRLATIK